LRQRLKGPQLAAYYPRRSATIADIQKEFARFDLETWNDPEEERLESLQIAKLRGKGPPKKKRTADSRFFNCRNITSYTNTMLQQLERSGRRNEQLFNDSIQ
jgi:hypothetical protein